MFKYEKIDNETFRIMGRGCDCYLLIGKKEALMIDSGCDENNIQKYAQTLTSKKVTSVINTHSHFDHTGGNGFFDLVYMTKQQEKSAKNWMDEDPTNLNLKYDISILTEGVFRFEGRELYIIECDCHSPGNIAILDETHRILFTGDEIDSDQVLLLPGFSEQAGQYHSKKAASVYDYLKMLLKLKTFEKDYDILCTGHNGSPLSKKYLDSFIELCQMILNGEKGVSNLESATYSNLDTHYPFEDAHYLRFSHKGCSLIYCSDDLYNRQNNSLIEPATPLHLICENNMRK